MLKYMELQFGLFNSVKNQLNSCEVNQKTIPVALMNSSAASEMLVWPSNMNRLFAT